MEYILIVDNNEQDLLMLKETLEKRYKVGTCRSKEEAVQILEHKIPDLLIVDSKEPETSVLELMEYVKLSEDLAKVPVVVISDGEDENFELRCMHLGASDFMFRPFSKVAVLSRVKRVLEYEMLKKNLHNEMNKQSAEFDEIRNMAKKDPLTKLWNRVYAEETINEYLQERRHRGAFLMLDMDNFKDINDTYGHIVGDEVLVEFAHTLEALTRQDDIVCRLGGDEFIVFLKDVSSRSSISEKVEQMIVTLEKRIVKPDGGGHVTVSIGVVVAPGDGRSFSQLYENADKSLYYVKQNGKGSYHFYSEEGMVDCLKSKKKGTQVDLDHLRCFIQEMGYKKGAYQVEYEGFKKIYRFVARCIGRTGQDVQTVLFTLTNLEGKLPDVQELIFSMDNLKNAVHESIRRGDVATNYSNSQFVVILMDSSMEDGIMVAKRIVDKYNELHCYHPAVELHYDIQTVNAAPTSNDF